MKNITISPVAREELMRCLAHMDFPEPIPWLTLTRSPIATGSADLQWEIVYCNRTPELEPAIISIDGVPLIADPKYLKDRRTRLHINYANGAFNITEDRDEEA